MKSTIRVLAFVLVLALLLTSSGVTSLADAVLTMPAELDIIDEEAFYGSTSINRVVLSNKVTEIRARAFAHSSLSEINLPDSLMFIDSSAFAGVSNLTVKVNPGSYAFDWALSNHCTISVPVTAATGDNRVDVTAGNVTLCKFTAPSAGEYVFTTKGDKDTKGVLYDASFSQLAEDDDEGAERNFLIYHTLTRGQTVYVGVKYFLADDSGTVTLNISKIPEVAVGSNNVEVPAGYEKLYKFTAPSAGTYFFSTNGEKDTKGILYDASKTVLYVDENSGIADNFRIRYTLTQGQNVYIGVRYNGSDEDGTETLGIVKLKQVSLGNNSVEITGRTEAMCTFTAPSAGNYIFTTTGSNDTIGVLYDDSDNMLADNDDNDEGRNFKIEYTLTSGQTVYVGVRYYDNNINGTETLNISKQASEVTVTLGDNSVPVTAGNETMCRFTAPSDSTYIFTTTGANDTVGALYDANKNSLADNDDGGDGANFSIEYALSSGQTVYIGVKYYNTSLSGTETLNISRQTSGVTVTLGDNSVAVTAGNETMCRFTVPSDGSYIFTTTGTNDTMGVLYDANKNSLADNDDGGDGANFRIECTLTGGQTVYIGVKYYNTSLSGTETLRIFRPSALTITTNPAAQTVDEGDSVTFSVTASGGNGIIGYQWYRASSSTAAGNAISGATDNSYTFTASSADDGYYFYCVVASGTVTATSSRARLTVNEEPAPVQLSAPTGFRFTGVTRSAVSVSFNSVSGASGYYVYYSTSSTFRQTNSKVSASYSSGVWEAYIGSLSSGTRYYFWAAAYDSSGNVGDTSSLTTYTLSATVSLSNYYSGQTYSANNIYDFSISDNLYLDWDLTNSYDNKIIVKSFVMTNRTQFDGNDASAASYYFYDSSEFTASSLSSWNGAVPFGDFAGHASAGNYVKIWVGTRDKHYDVNGQIVGVQFALKLTQSSFDPIWPCASTYIITCLYKYSSGDAHSTRYETAIDIGGGGNIVATESGTVITATTLSGSFGNYVVIDHGNDMVSLYGHLSSRNVSVGDNVTKGQVIGVMGSTGNANGVHLHFELANKNTKLGDPWKDYFRSKYVNSLIYHENCYLNNNPQDCKNWIITHCYKNGSYYYPNK